MKRIDIRKFKQPFVILTIAPPLCGKSTYVSKLDLSNIIVISRDAIMLELHGNDNYDEAYDKLSPKEVNEEMHNRINAAKKANKNVIIDMMNLSSKRRKGTLQQFGKKYYKVGLVFDIPNMKVLKERNEKRKTLENKNISMELLESLIGDYKPIVPEEGFDKIITI